MPSELYVGAPVVLQFCDQSTTWDYTEDLLLESKEKPGFCISTSTESIDLVTAICDPDDNLQKFEF